MRLVQLGGEPGGVAAAGGRYLICHRARARRERRCHHQCHQGGGLMPRHVITPTRHENDFLTRAGKKCSIGAYADSSQPPWAELWRHRRAPAVDASLKMPQEELISMAAPSIRTSRRTKDDEDRRVTSTFSG